MTDEETYTPDVVKDRPWHMILVIAVIAVVVGLGIAVYSAGYTSGSKTVDHLQTRLDLLDSRLTRANKTQNNLSEGIVVVSGATAQQKQTSACRQHRSQFEKIMDSNQKLRESEFIFRVVNKPVGVDLATDPASVASLQAYEKAAADYQRAVLAPDLCL